MSIKSKPNTKNPFDNMAMIPKRALGLCCFYIVQLMTHLAYLNSTVYLAVMLQPSWHTAEGNKESKGIYIYIYIYIKALKIT